MQELINLQHKLEAPKNKKNTFWNYNYRSTEDILGALKSLLMEEGCFLTLTDDIIQLGDRFYVKATATLTKGEKSVSTSAFARESLDKKWMDSSQITGSASSYARKYALNGLFAIDDTVDADWHEPPKNEVWAKTAKQEQMPEKWFNESDFEDWTKSWCDTSINAWTQWMLDNWFTNASNKMKEKVKNYFNP